MTEVLSWLAPFFLFSLGPQPAQYYLHIKEIPSLLSKYSLGDSYRHDQKFASLSPDQGISNAIQLTIIISCHLFKHTVLYKLKHIVSEVVFQ